MGLFRHKKKDKSKPSAIGLLLHDLVSPVIQKLSAYTRYHGRKRLANRWARHNPKKFMYSYISLAAVILTYTVVSTFIFEKKQEKRAFSVAQTLGDVDMHQNRIRENEMLIKAEIKSFAEESILMANELDSLSKLETKTHTDSVRMVNLLNALSSAYNINNDNKQ